MFRNNTIGDLAISNLPRHVATLGFIGYIPYAPGTFATAVSFSLVFLLKLDNLKLLLIFLFLFPIGLLTSHNAEKSLGRDSRHIVIDEFCGYLVCIFLIPEHITYLLAAFFLFRFFDVVKPPPIKKIGGALKGGIGIMLDDLIAGVYTNICIQLWRLLFVN